MALSQTSRRSLIKSGLMTAIGVSFPAGNLAAAESPAWMAQLLTSVKGISSWVRAGIDGDGIATIHCGMSDPSAWVARAGNLSGKGQKVLARGNVLTVRIAENQARIIIHPDLA